MEFGLLWICERICNDNGRFKNRLGRDETLKRACPVLPRFLIEELTSRNKGMRTFVPSRTNGYKNINFKTDDSGVLSFREGHQLAKDLLMLATSQHAQVRT